MDRTTAGAPRTEAAEMAIRLVTPGDHRVLKALPGLVPGFALGTATAVGRGTAEGFGWGWGLGVGGVIALGAVLGMWLMARRVPRRRILRMGPEGMAFSQEDVPRWAVPWDAVRAADVVLGTRADGKVTDQFVVLDLCPEAAPDDATLPHHDGRWWLRLTGTDATLIVPRELRRRLPGRVPTEGLRDDGPPLVGGLPPEIFLWR